MITGGAGFIGSALARLLIAETDWRVLVFDKLTYAGRLSSLAAVAAEARYQFIQGDIGDAAAVASALADFRPTVVTNLAAETHVDRSIDGPAAFVQTNVVGTFVLLDQALAYWRGLDAAEQAAFRLHHVSTDEVYGSLGADGAFTETSAYYPRSPYAASKAASDHLVRAWGCTYGLPVLITNASNNYGPFHFPEKLIPLMLIRALGGLSLPVYGDGGQVRDWLFVEDHARALRRVFEAGAPGSTYNIGAGDERRNLEVVQALCAILDRLHPRSDGLGYAAQIEHVADRPGHDRRYAIDPAKVTSQLGWRPQVDFETGLERTVRWYLDNRDWWEPILAEGDATGRRGLA
jgi:dTDP-glucose 4,6-dehydratase